MPLRCVTSLAVAIGLFSACAARAEDQPITDEPSADDVRICEAYGPGYQLVPGTSTCIKIEGMVRMDIQATSPGQAAKPPEASDDQ